MVRFKNRHLLVEFLTPSSLTPVFPAIPTPASKPLTNPTNPSARVAQNEVNKDDDDEDDHNEDEEGMIEIPQIPFMLPLPEARLRLSGDGAAAVHRAVRAMVQDVFGDEGWGRVASSFKGMFS